MVSASVERRQDAGAGGAVSLDPAGAGPRRLFPQTAWPRFALDKS